MENKSVKLKSGKITTISVPKTLKERIDELKDDEETYAEFLYDLTREDVISEVDRLRRSGESRGEVIKNACRGNPRSKEELDTLREVAASSGAEVTGKGESVLSLSPEEEQAIRESLENG